MIIFFIDIKGFFFPILYTACYAFPYFILPLSFPLFFSLPPKSLDNPTPCTFSVLKAFEKNKEVLKYILFQKISTIPEIWKEWIIGTIGYSFVEEINQ